jgi:hypothetical protein
MLGVARQNNSNNAGRVITRRGNGTSCASYTAAVDMTSRARISITLALGCLWSISLVFGLRTLVSYESTPGKVGRVPESWPADSKIALGTDTDTLIMLAHPFCPCTRASIGELAQIIARAPGKLRSYVLFLKPENSGPDWDDTELRKAAAAIPGVTVVSDLDGSEARRFGAETSGYTLLFDPKGHRLFRGGITASRGHAGGNSGESAIVALVNGHPAAQDSSFVFGCALNSTRDATK